MATRNLIILAAAGLLALGAGYAAATLPEIPRGDDTKGATQDVERIVRSVYMVCKLDEDCIKSGLELVANAAPADSVRAALRLFDTPDAPGPGCHWGLHLLGQTFKERTRSGEDLGLRAHWHVCGYAVLHGAFEDVPLEGSVAEMGRAAFDLCINGVLEGERIGQCFHPIGHTLEMNLPGSTEAPYLLRVETACASGAWHARTTIPSETALKACVSGAHMRHRDGVIKPAGRNVFYGGAPAAALPQCEHSLLPYACITLYMEDAFSGGRASSAGDAGRLLEWCVAKSPEAGEVCGYFFGLALGNSVRAAGTAAAVCVSFEALDERVRVACLRGLFERTSEGAQTIGTDGFCTDLEALAVTCESVNTFVPRYPETAEPVDLLARIGADPTLLTSQTTPSTRRS